MISHNLLISYLKTFLFFIFVLSIPTISVKAQSNNEINPVAKSHLSLEKIGTMTSSEILATNFLFTSSFIVDTTTAGYKKWLKDHDGVFDISVLNTFRKQSERSFYKNEFYPDFVVELFSWNEIQSEYKKLSN
jgi:hypothetical protein